jgi:hypothetical protein
VILTKILDSLVYTIFDLLVVDIDLDNRFS